jgi:hypothetical protein
MIVWLTDYGFSNAIKFHLRKYENRFNIEYFEMCISSEKSSTALQYSVPRNEEPATTACRQQAENEVVATRNSRRRLGTWAPSYVGFQKRCRYHNCSFILHARNFHLTGKNLSGISNDLHENHIPPLPNTC